MSEQPAGVMQVGYAVARRRSRALGFRYRVRARMAVEAYRARQPQVRAPAVLELGCAEGRTLLEVRALLASAGRCDGVDLSEGLLAAAPPLPAATRLWRADVCALPAELPAGSYDLCLALAVLEHLPDPAAALGEAWRMLRPGGVLVLSCPEPRWDALAGRLGLVPGEHHEHALGRAELLRLCREAGFVDVVARPFMWAPVGFLPYLRVPVSPRLSLCVDAWVRRARWLDFGFVNQAVLGCKPSGAGASTAPAAGGRDASA